MTKKDKILLGISAGLACFAVVAAISFTRGTPEPVKEPEPEPKPEPTPELQMMAFVEYRKGGGTAQTAWNEYLYIVIYFSRFPDELYDDSRPVVSYEIADRTGTVHTGQSKIDRNWSKYFLPTERIDLMFIDSEGVKTPEECVTIPEGYAYYGTVLIKRYASNRPKLGEELPSFNPADYNLKAVYVDDIPVEIGTANTPKE